MSLCQSTIQGFNLRSWFIEFHTLPITTKSRDSNSKFFVHVKDSSKTLMRGVQNCLAPLLSYNLIKFDALAEYALTFCLLNVFPGWWCSRTQNWIRSFSLSWIRGHLMQLDCILIVLSKGNIVLNQVKPFIIADTESCNLGLQLCFNIYILVFLYCFFLPIERL